MVTKDYLATTEKLELNGHDAPDWREKRNLALAWRKSPHKSSKAKCKLQRGR